jgi:hypothetical protein
MQGGDGQRFEIGNGKTLSLTIRSRQRRLHIAVSRQRRKTGPGSLIDDKRDVIMARKRQIRCFSAEIEPLAPCMQPTSWLRWHRFGAALNR